ncbi:MAG: tetratricopeptide repeat protein [Proteobacteria bacterium]|nr:tetratricopeptide repeat protein [Pseudomonadota bacterium]
MAKRSRGSAGADSALDRVFTLLDQSLSGMHDVTPPSGMRLPADLPEALIELYAHCDGARLFLDTIELHPANEVVRDGEGAAARWTFGTFEDEPLTVDARGHVWRDDASIDAPVCEGTSLERYLSGLVDATALLYDEDGEFAENVFDDDGEIESATIEKQLRAQLKRDAKAPGPRWRLAHVLLAQHAKDDARRQLEELVANDPKFAWGWLELARLAESDDDLDVAEGDAIAGAEAAKGHDQEGYFWAQVARIAARKGDEVGRATAAAHAARLSPGLKTAQLEGAKAQLTADDVTSARGLVELLRAVWPRDLEVLDLVNQIAKHVPAPPVIDGDGDGDDDDDGDGDAP